MPSMLSIPKSIDDTLRSVMVLNLLGKEFKGLFNGTEYAGGRPGCTEQNGTEEHVKYIHQIILNISTGMAELC